MSVPEQSGVRSIAEPRDGAARREGGDTEEFDALPVLAGEPAVLGPYRLQGSSPTYWRARSTVIPAAQAAVVAAGGFVAGAAVIGLVSRRQRHPAARRHARRAARAPGRAAAKRGASKAGELVQIVSSRSLLVDVHLLAGRD